MPDVYVYSPVDGIITGRSNYCIPCPAPCSGDQGTHSTCRGWSSPVDVDAVDNEQVVLYVNSLVKSIRTFVENRCCSAACGNDYRRAITVELYGQLNANCLIGSVMYGHVSNPQVTHNTVYNLAGTSKILGNAPGGNCGTCYTGSHTHMERSGGSTVAPCCCVDTVKGSTAIYKWIGAC